MLPQVDLFGQVIEKDVILRDTFIEPPFSVLDTRSGSWQSRKRQWIHKGIKSEVRERIVNGNNALGALVNREKEQAESTSKIRDTADGVTFDPALCEVLYHWFCPKGGTILDPFAGGSVRGIVAQYLGYYYTGIDIRVEQIASNREQALEILKVNNQPNYYVGDSNKVLDELVPEYDFVFSCPPYGDLEGDISNMEYEKFLVTYESIIAKSCKKLKRGGFACFVVGEFRDKQGYYRGFVPDTIRAFDKCGMKFYNEAILLTAIASASMRAANTMTHKKLVKVHQNVLVFVKP
jgi:DNA modification methylase